LVIRNIEFSPVRYRTGSVLYEIGRIRSRGREREIKDFL
jgi:hypothetical protein